MSDEPEAAEPSPAHAYFRAIEERFIALRGAPLLVSPEDWQVARRWHQEGVPIDLVGRVLEELMERRRARGTRGRVGSLRYFEAAVDAAWAEVRDLSAVASRTAAAPLEVETRLASLAEALPASLPDRGRWGEQLRALEGGAENVEASLAELDRELLETLLDRLDPEQRSELEAEGRRALAALGERIPGDERPLVEERLIRQALRRRLGLPVLSLFSPEAVPEPPPDD